MSEAGASLEAAAVSSPVAKTRWLSAAWGAFQPQLDASPNAKDRGWAAAFVAAHANSSWVNGTRMRPTEVSRSGPLNLRLA